MERSVTGPPAPAKQGFDAAAPVRGLWGHSGAVTNHMGNAEKNRLVIISPRWRGQEGIGGNNQDSQIIGQPLWVYVVRGSPMSSVVLTNEILSPLVSGKRQWDRGRPSLVCSVTV